MINVIRGYYALTTRINVQMKVNVSVRKINYTLVKSCHVLKLSLCHLVSIISVISVVFYYIYIYIYIYIYVINYFCRICI